MNLSVIYELSCPYWTILSLLNYKNKQNCQLAANLNSIIHRQPKLCGSSLGFEFIRECMKINKIRPKFHFSTKNRNKNDLPCVCVLLFTVSSPLEPFGSRAFYWRLRFWVVLTVKRNGKAGDSEAGRSSSWKWSKLAKIAVKGSVDNLPFPSI